MVKKSNSETKRGPREIKPFFIKMIYTGVSYQVIERDTGKVVYTTESKELATANAATRNASAKEAALKNASAKVAALENANA